MDRKDKLILAYLCENMRYSAGYIARQTGLKQSLVNYRIKQLFAKGVITRTFPRFFMTNLKLIRAYEVCIKLLQVNLKRKRDIITRLCAHPNITYVVEVEGDWHLRLFIKANSLATSQEVFDYINNVAGAHLGVAEVLVPSTIHPLHELFFAEKALPIGKKVPKDGSLQDAFVATKPFLYEGSLDATDFAILRALGKDLRQSFRSLAEKLGVSRELVIDRLRKMIVGHVLIGFSPAIDHNTLGYNKYYLYYQLVDDVQEQFIALMRSFSSVASYARFIGKWNVMVTVYVKDNNELDAIDSAVLEKFSEQIKDTARVREVKEHCFKILPDNMEEQYATSVVSLHNL